MPKINSIVGKGKIAAAADRHLQVPTQAALDGLKTNARLSDRGLDPSVGVIEPSDKQHTDDDWFGPNWWSQFPDKEKIVRETYIKALELSLANAQPKPIVTYWVRGCNTFEAMVAESNQQLTVFLLTPDPPPSTLPPPTQSFLEKMWVIAKSDRTDALTQTYPSTYVVPVDDTNEPDIKCLRVVGY